MSFSPQPGSEKTEDIEIPFQHVAKFVRQISHDVRNNLGSMDLQAAYAMELITDAEVIAELRKLRGMITTTAKMLQVMSRSFQAPKPEPITLAARILLEDFRDRFMKLHPEEAPRLEWRIELADEVISVDIELIFGALLECCRNAIYFDEGKENIGARVFAQNAHLVLELQQRRETVDGPVDGWGRNPFVSARRSGYGLGLFHARQVLGAHGGDVEFVHTAQENTLTTRVRLPLASASSDA
jgi:K+-sensing histidine kinase KdpD